jgi:hypothetical protein
MCFRKLPDALKLYPNYVCTSTYLGGGAMRVSKRSTTTQKIKNHQDEQTIVFLNCTLKIVFYEMHVLQMLKNMCPEGVVFRAGLLL